MNASTRKMIEETLGMYGAKLTEDDGIEKLNGSDTGVRILIHENRMRFVSVYSGHLFMIGQIEPETLIKFVEGFWAWNKLN